MQAIASWPPFKPADEVELCFENATDNATDAERLRKTIEELQEKQ